MLGEMPLKKLAFVKQQKAAIISNLILFNLLKGGSFKHRRGTGRHILYTFQNVMPKA